MKKHSADDSLLQDILPHFNHPLLQTIIKKMLHSLKDLCNLSLESLEYVLFMTE